MYSVCPKQPFDLSDPDPSYMSVLQLKAISCFKMAEEV